MKPQRSVLFALSLLAACGERVGEQEGQGSTTPPYVRPETESSQFENMVQPVRIGELGPSFAACNARGATRDRVGGGPVPVRAAPFEQEGEIDRLMPGSEFFICSRTYDQRWLGIVYDEGGRAADRCGVSEPVPARRNYQGPCAAGWVPSARVRLVPGTVHQLPLGTEADTPLPSD